MSITKVDAELLSFCLPGSTGRRHRAPVSLLYYSSDFDVMVESASGYDGLPEGCPRAAETGESLQSYTSSVPDSVSWRLGFVYLPLSKLPVPNPTPVYTYASSPFMCDCARGSCVSGYLSGIPTLIPHALDPTLYFHACLYGSRSPRGPGLLIYSSSRLLLALLFNERTRPATISADSKDSVFCYTTVAFYLCL
jgi:hypothetical protein